MTENSEAALKAAGCHERVIDYLRISVTDRCNLRCQYCMPEKVPSVQHAEILRYEEILEIAAAGAEEGIRHVRVTGGEPLVRKDCPELIRSLKGIPGIETAGLTTNGILLSEQLEAVKYAGTDSINISLDTTDRLHYRKITGCDGRDIVLQAVADCVSCGINVKINVAVMEETTAEEIISLAELSRSMPVHVRFIEMMPIGCGVRFHAVDNGTVLKIIREKYPDIRPVKDDPGRLPGFGPAVYFQIPGFSGETGFISAIHGKFCDRCNRLRLTSTGFLKYCLCYDAGEDLRKIVRSSLSAAQKRDRLRAAFRKAAAEKPEGHCFGEHGKMTEKKPMVEIGG